MSKLETAGITLFFVVIFYMAFIILPIGIYNEQQCLAKGYPAAAITITLDTYCIGVKGSSSTVVIKQ